MYKLKYSYFSQESVKLKLKGELLTFSRYFSEVGEAKPKSFTFSSGVA